MSKWHSDWIIRLVITTSVNNSNDFIVGCFNDGSKSFNGAIDFVSISRYRASEMVSIYDGDLDHDNK